MVTGRPFIALKMPMKSSRWIGSSLARAVLRLSDVLGAGSSRACGMRSWPKNMCSVRHRPMPSAPNFARHLGIVRRVGVGAHLQRAVLVGPLHELGEVAGHLGAPASSCPEHLAGGAVQGDPVALVDRRAVRRVNCLSSSSIVMSPAPATQGLPMPRATTAAWEVMPPGR